AQAADLARRPATNCPVRERPRAEPFPAPHRLDLALDRARWGMAEHGGHPRRHTREIRARPGPMVHDPRGNPGAARTRRMGPGRGLYDLRVLHTLLQDHDGLRPDAGTDRRDDLTPGLPTSSLAGQANLLDGAPDVPHAAGGVVRANAMRCACEGHVEGTI